MDVVYIKPLSMYFLCKYILITFIFIECYANYFGCVVMWYEDAVYGEVWCEEVFTLLDSEEENWVCLGLFVVNQACIVRGQGVQI